MPAAAVAALMLPALFMVSCNESAVSPVAESPRSVAYQWPTSTPADEGISAALIDSAAAVCAKNSNIYSFIIVRNGFLVREYYQEQLHDYNEFEIRSATKSFISVLVGIALEQGIIDSLDQPMLSFFPEFDTDDLDARTRTITVRHLLTMRAGFDYTDLLPDPNLYTAKDHWVRQTIRLPLKYAPGERFYYASVQTHLLSAIIAKQSGMSTLEFGKKYLFDPAGIRIGHWDQDPQGVYFGGSGMMMTSRSMARLGDVILRNGFVNGTQLIPKEWLNQLSLPTLAADHSWGSFTAVNYGFLWWTNTSGIGNFFFAAGSGGQFIIILPSKNAVIVTTANPNVAPASVELQELQVIEIITRYLIPSIQS